jgi:hypothetical protein
VHAAIRRLKIQAAALPAVPVELDIDAAIRRVSLDLAGHARQPQSPVRGLQIHATVDRIDGIAIGRFE